MKSHVLIAALALAAALPASLGFAQSRTAPALDGEPYIHDPVHGHVLRRQVLHLRHRRRRPDVRRRLDLAQRGATRPGGGVAPDVIKIGDRYYMAYARAAAAWRAGTPSNVYVMWTKTLDPKSPDFGFHDETVVASSDGIEDCDAIDPAFLLDPTDWPAVAHLRHLLRLTSASSSSIPRPASAWKATSPSTSPSTWKPRR